MIDGLGEGAPGSRGSASRAATGSGGSVILRRGADDERDARASVMSHLDTCTRSAPRARTCGCGWRATGLYGPGVYDMKGGAYLALAGLPRGWRARAPPGARWSTCSPPTRRSARRRRAASSSISAREGAGGCSSPSRPAAAAKDRPPCRKGDRPLRRARRGDARPIPARATPTGRNAIHEAARQSRGDRGADGLCPRRDDDGRHDQGRTAMNTIPQHCRCSAGRLCASRPRRTGNGTSPPRILGLAPQKPDFKVRVHRRLELARPSSARPRSPRSSRRRWASPPRSGFPPDRDLPHRRRLRRQLHRGRRASRRWTGSAIDGDGAHRSTSTASVLCSLAPRRKADRGGFFGVGLSAHPPSRGSTLGRPRPGTARAAPGRARPAGSRGGLVKSRRPSPAFVRRPRSKWVSPVRGAKKRPPVAAPLLEGARGIPAGEHELDPEQRALEPP